MMIVIDLDNLTDDDREQICLMYREDLLGLAIELAAADERASALVMSITIAARIAELTPTSRCWS
jgi:hypothetical protein